MHSTATGWKTLICTPVRANIVADVDVKIQYTNLAHDKFDECVRDQMVKDKEELEDLQEESIIIRQSLECVDQRVEGSVFGVGGGISGSGQPVKDNMNFVDEEITDALGNPLPQLQGALLLQNQELV